MAQQLSSAGVKISGHKRRLLIDENYSPQGYIETANSRARTCKRSEQNADGQNALHLLCQDPSAPLSRVSVLINSHPEMLEQFDVYGRSPVFYALKRACSVEVVSALYDGFPAAITQQDFCGDSPLYLLYHSSKDYRILRHVLGRNPRLALHKESAAFGQPLVKRICAPWASKQIISSSEMEGNSVLKDRWTKLVMTVRAAHNYTMGLGRSDETPELHLALAFPCPPMVICHFLEMYPKQASIITANEGCLPLHYFLLYSIARHDGEAVIEGLLRAFPAAAVIWYKRRLPIHLALAAGLTWQTGIRDILFADTSVLCEIDGVEGLLPFAQAGAHQRTDLSTIYCLLRENPAVLCRFL